MYAPSWSFPAFSSSVLRVLAIFFTYGECFPSRFLDVFGFIYLTAVKRGAGGGVGGGGWVRSSEFDALCHNNSAGFHNLAMTCF